MAQNDNKWDKVGKGGAEFCKAERARLRSESEDRRGSGNVLHQPTGEQGPVTTAPSEHPLSRQFRRERFSQGPNRTQGSWRDRRTPGGQALGSRPAGSRFRKSHY